MPFDLATIPTSTVVQVTSDINLQNMARVAGLPVVEPPSLKDG